MTFAVMKDELQSKQGIARQLSLYQSSRIILSQSVTSDRKRLVND